MKTIRFNRADCPAWILAEVDAGREVYNAPRPINGKVPGPEDGAHAYAGIMGAFSGVFGHGVLFASLDPSLPGVERARKVNEDMDARLVELTDDAAERAAWETKCREQGYEPHYVAGWDRGWAHSAKNMDLLPSEAAIAAER